MLFLAAVMLNRAVQRGLAALKDGSKQGSDGMVDLYKIDSDEALASLLKCKEEIVIYGAGHYGHVIKGYIEMYFHRSIYGFAVSKTENLTGMQGERVDIIGHYERSCNLIIAVSEQHQSELLENLEALGFERVSVLLNEFVRYMEARLDKNRLDVRETLGFEVHITEHCNLNCRGCYHFSPLAGEEYLSLDEYKKDLIRLRDLCGDRVDRVTLLGGEPLLHPEIIGFIQETRQIHKGCRLEILTNGILLAKMEEAFWRACQDNAVSLCCTKYPIEVDYDYIEELALGYGLSVSYHNDIGAGEKTLIKYPFDIGGKQNQIEAFSKCTRGNLCITLKHGRLYPCPMAAHAHLAKEYFNLEMELSDTDYIDIYQAKNMGELMNFFVRPINFCKYCDLSNRPTQMEWGVSKKKIKEWF